LTLFKKGPEGGLGAFAFCLWLLCEALAWVFCFGLLLLAIWCGKLLKGKRIIEEKRIAKGKLLKEKEWLKRG
jgi:hypothetical protein